MTLREYYIAIKAHSLREIDKLVDYAKFLMIQRKANVTKHSGNKEIYVYDSIDKLVDSKKMEEEILYNKTSKKFDRLMKIAKRRKERR